MRLEVRGRVVFGVGGVGDEESYGEEVKGVWWLRRWRVLKRLLSWLLGVCLWRYRFSLLFS